MSDKLEVVNIKKLIFEDETGARVTVVIPRGGVYVQPGGILRNISLGAISTTGMINDFKRARVKSKELKDQGVQGATEIVHGSTQDRLTPEAQAASAMEGSEVPPVFVADGDEKKNCSCDHPMGTRRCLNCGLLISRD